MLVRLPVFLIPHGSAAQRSGTAKAGPSREGGDGDNDTGLSHVFAEIACGDGGADRRRAGSIMDAALIGHLPRNQPVLRKSQQKHRILLALKRLRGDSASWARLSTSAGVCTPQTSSEFRWTALGEVVGPPPI